MAVVDMHVHVYPDKIAERATQSVGEFYHVEMSTEAGTLEQLMDVCEHTPIDRAVICSVAVKPKTVYSINDFIAESCKANPQFVGLAAMHQDLEDVEAELARARELGLAGIKIHPDTQGVNMDDERLMRVYAECEAHDMAVLMHCGDYRYDYSHPRRMKRILHEFPKLRVCAAHFGGWSVYDMALEFLEDERCFLDVSSAMRYLGSRRTRELIEDYGTDRMMFGSDFPMWNPSAEYAIFSALGFSSAEYERMSWRNAERWLQRDLG